MGYVVKNCPAYDCKYTECKNTKEIACLYRSNCLIKQIIEKCKNIENESDNIKNGNYQEKFKWFKIGRSDVGKEILQLFDIQEVD